MGNLEQITSSPWDLSFLTCKMIEMNLIPKSVCSKGPWFCDSTENQIKITISYYILLCSDIIFSLTMYLILTLYYPYIMKSMRRKQEESINTGILQGLILDSVLFSWKYELYISYLNKRYSFSMETIQACFFIFIASLC